MLANRSTSRFQFVHCTSSVQSRFDCLIPRKCHAKCDEDKQNAAHFASEDSQQLEMDKSNTPSDSRTLRAFCSYPTRSDTLTVQDRHAKSRTGMRLVEEEIYSPGTEKDNKSFPKPHLSPNPCWHSVCLRDS
jgi:hypothetical protein